MISEFYRILAFFIIILLAPAFFVLAVIVRLDSNGPFLFTQKRAGKGRRPFKMYKIRSMFLGAEKLQKKYLTLSETDGPAFKIYNDPRHTRIGRVLAHSGLDELPQLINIIRGEMSFVGPRPLPISEARKVPKRYTSRFTVLPGITSSWVVEGSHKLSFDQWMKLDVEYVKKQSIFFDLAILVRTVNLISRALVSEITK